MELNKYAYICSVIHFFLILNKAKQKHYDIYKTHLLLLPLSPHTKSPPGEIKHFINTPIVIN